MKKLVTFFLFVSFTFTLLSQGMGWPKVKTVDKNVLSLYQPSVESWTQNEYLDFRMAFTLVPNKEKEIVGVVYLTASTDVDMNTHTVAISNFNIQKVDFPSLDSANAAQADQFVRTFLVPDSTITMPLEQLVATTKKPETTSTVKVNNEPPKIFISVGPGILLQLEGEAKLESTKGDKESTLEYILNANWPVFYDKNSNKNYLYDDLEWQVSTDLSGPWEFTSTLPQELVELVEDSAWSILKPAIPAPIEASKNMPKIFFSEVQAEIILFDGQPKYVSIKGTELEYCINTESDVFFCIDNNSYYYLTSGRWFNSKSLNGPWVFATNDLPADFSKIPADSPAAVVLPSVPGTDQAADAVMIAQIPTTQVVNPQEAEKDVSVVYSGTPKFEPIDQTSLDYAVNTSSKVIEVSSSSYYLCSNGIWFTASSPQGPWITATSIPASIYTIPPSSPVYNVTYVTQTTTSSGNIQSSYTAGYMGALVVGVTVGAIVASGTGYYHPPYYYYPPYGYPVCYHYPCTYGAYAYHAYPYYGGAYHASYNPYTGTYARGATAYGPYGSRSVGQAYNPYTGTAARGASVSTPYGTASAAHAYNPYTGASASTRQGANAYGQAGVTTASDGHGQYAAGAHETTSQGTVGRAETSTGGKAVGYSGQGGSGSVAKSGDGDLYASKDGNVYKNSNGSWQKYDNGSWNSTNTPTPHSGDNSGSGNFSKPQGDQMSSLNSEAQNRQSGNFQSHQFSQGRSFGGFGGSGGFSGGGFGGGGFRGGAGGFRR
jgi:hypothetical protein